MSARTMSGTITALVTPFRADGALDEAALEVIIGEQLHAEVEGLVLLGTTGESPTVSAEEAGRILAIAVRLAQGKTRIIAGCGSNDTRKTISAARQAHEMGVDALLVVSPYYNKPTQEGLARHFLAVAEATPLPLIVYNIPGRTGVNITCDTMLRLAEHSRIVAAKEASGDLNQIADLLAAAPEDFSVLSGDDGLTLPILALGGRGVISVVSNLVPGRVKKLVDSALGDDFRAARAIHERLLPLIRACFLETNPIPIKTALARWGRIQEIFRPPLYPMCADLRDQLYRCLVHFQPS